MSPVASEILIRPVRIVPRIGFVMLLIVRPQIFCRKAVMRRDKVHGRRFVRPFVAQIVRSGHTLRHFGGKTFIPAPEPPRIIAETVVPLHPVFLEISDLITASAAVPRFGNQFAF